LVFKTEDFSVFRKQDIVMEDERNRIWDYLYNVGAPRSVEDIARSLEMESTVVTSVVDHEWFTTEGVIVSIA
jgi:hypothetical protein